MARRAKEPRERTARRWLDGLLACPTCGRRLASDGGGPHGLYLCGRCGPYPRLAGVPVLVPHPAGWCASFREAVLASLAEVDAATRAAVDVVDAFAAAAPGAEAQRFGDDWTVDEAVTFGALDGAARSGKTKAAAPPGPSRRRLGEDGRGAVGRAAREDGRRDARAGASPMVGGPAAVQHLLQLARRAGPAAWLAARVPTGGAVLEVGCGAGQTSARVAARASRLVVGDVSLRAVLKARARALEAGGDVEAVVLDAEALPFRRGAFDAVLAEHLVDLLDAPADFLGSARRVLEAAGVLLVTTPEPSLGTDDDGAVEGLARVAGFRVQGSADGLVWTRVHSARFVEVYVVRGLALGR